MADWIKMTTVLQDKPEVVWLSAQTGLDRYAVVGRLHALWSWFDQHTTNGMARGVTPAFIDELVRHEGFANFLEKVGWIVVSDEGCRVPKFNSHNGNSAKKRALQARRASRFRNAPSVTKSAPEQTDRQTGEKNKNLSEERGAKCARPVCLTAGADETLADFLRRAKVREPARAAMLAIEGLTAAEFAEALRDATESTDITNPIGAAIAAVFSCRGLTPPRGRNNGHISVDPELRELARLRAVKNGQVMR